MKEIIMTALLSRHINYEQYEPPCYIVAPYSHFSPQTFKTYSWMSPLPTVNQTPTHKEQSSQQDEDEKPHAQAFQVPT